MQRTLRFYQTLIGKKVIMAVTGAMLVLFVIGHMVGNLKIFQGQVEGHYKIDAYAEGLREFGDPFLGAGQFLWLARAGLLAAVLLHIWAAFEVSKSSVKARSDKYKRRQSVASTYASRTMRWGGVLIALFVVYHILHLTTGQAHSDFRYGEVYRNMVAGFLDWKVSAFYILAMLALGLHLYHGVWSGFQTLGVSPEGKDWRRGLSALIAVTVTVGNISMPVAVLAGWVRF